MKNFLDGRLSFPSPQSEAFLQRPGCGASLGADETLGQVPRPAGAWTVTCAFLLVIQFGLLTAALARTSSDDQITVVSLNLQEKGDLDALEIELKSVDSMGDPDIVLLQEVVAQADDESELFPGELADRLGLSHAYSPDRSLKEGPPSPRLAILSRYPMKCKEIVPLPELKLFFKSRRRYALDAVIEAPQGELRVFNLHLDSRVNFADRMLQLTPILNAASLESRPVLIGGDFNSNDFWWLMHVVPIPFVSDQDDDLLAQLVTRGFSTPLDGSAGTHDFLHLKLDWLFGKWVAWVSHGVVPVKISDHHLVWARFRLGRPPAGVAGLLPWALAGAHPQARRGGISDPD